MVTPTAPTRIAPAQARKHQADLARHRLASRACRPGNTTNRHFTHRLQLGYLHARHQAQQAMVGQSSHHQRASLQACHQVCHQECPLVCPRPEALLEVLPVFPVRLLDSLLDFRRSSSRGNVKIVVPFKAKSAATLLQISSNLQLRIGRLRKDASFAHTKRLVLKEEVTSHIQPRN